MPWIAYTAHTTRLTRAVDAMLSLAQEDQLGAIQELTTSVELALLSIRHLIKARFNTDYETVLTANLAKIHRRTQQGTIFDKSGGDDR